MVIFQSVFGLVRLEYYPQGGLLDALVLFWAIDVEVYRDHGVERGALIRCANKGRGHGQKGGAKEEWRRGQKRGEDRGDWGTICLWESMQLNIAHVV